MLFKNAQLTNKIAVILLVVVCWVLALLIYYKQVIPTVVIQQSLEHPLKDKKTVRVLIVGDTGSGDTAQKSVAQLLERLCEEKKAEAVLLLGDNFYFEGVSSLSDPQWDSKFEEIYNSPCLKDKRFYAVLGNHDYRGAPNAQIYYTLKSEYRWNMPARFYDVTFGSILSLFAIDSNFPEFCGFAKLCSLDWILKKMKESMAHWKVVMGHHPVLSGGKYPEPKWFAGITLPMLICKGKADFYLAGHDHNLQHLVGPYRNSACSINQLVAGSGGGDLVDVKPVEGKTKFAIKTHGAIFAEFSETSAVFEYYNTEKENPVYFFRQDKK